MNKNTYRSLIAGAILLVLYLMVALMLPFDRNPVFWLSLGATVLAFLVTAGALYNSILRQPDARSKFYGFPVVRIAVIYCLVQLVVGLLLMILGQWIETWIVVLIYAFILGAAVLGLIAVDVVSDHIQEQDQQMKKDTVRMRALQSRANQLLVTCSDPQIKKFAEELRYSDPVSSPALQEVEQDLIAAVSDLESAVVDGNSQEVEMLCNKATAILLERNRLCKLNKH